MTPARVAVLDYGAGNLQSVCHAVSTCGGNAYVASHPSELGTFSHMVLPGVGAMATAMGQLNESGMATVIVDSARRGIPILGICLGMQLMATAGDEGGHEAGLDLIPGTVQRIPTDSRGSGPKLPRLGWYETQHLEDAVGSRSQDILAQLPLRPYFYYAHSYHVRVADDRVVSAVTPSGSHELVAAIQLESVYGLQFHPEKSGKAGLMVVRSFLDVH